MIHRFPRNVAQFHTYALGGEEKQREHQQAKDRQPPFERQHDRQRGDQLNRIGDDADECIADRRLRRHDIVIEAAHQFAGLGVREEAQRHALQVRV